jgi:hypothetical protein
MIPIQKLSRAKKTKTWGKSVLDHLDSLLSLEETNGRISREDKQAYYNLYNNIIDESRIRYVLDDVSDGKKSFPAKFRHYDKISPKLMLLFGEEAKRPFNFRVINKSQSAFTRAQEKKKEMIIMMVSNMVNGMEIPDPNQPQAPQTPSDIEKYMNYNYRDMYEVTASQLLNHLIEEQQLIHKFNEGFKDALISTEEIYWVGEIQGKPVVRLCNPLNITVLTSPDSPWIEDAWAVIEERYLTIPEIIDEFNKDLSDSEIADLEARFRNSDGSSPFKGYERPMVINTSNPWVNKADVYASNSTSGIYKVLRYEWQSMRRVGFIQYSDEYGYEYTDLVGEEFEVPEIATKTKEGYEWTVENTVFTYSEYWINEWWEGTKIITNGDPIYLNIKPKTLQRRSIENPSICKSGYIGYVYNARNSKPISLVGRMESTQYLYDILYYRTELAFAKSFGSTQIWDLALMPKDHINDLEKWMYYAKAMGVLFVNSAEGIHEGKGSPMNVMREINDSTLQYINNNITMLAKLEDELEQVCGISRQRQGQVQTSELVGNTERAVVQSSHITEYWFQIHNEIKGKVLQAILDQSKHTYKKGFKIQYITDEVQRMFLELSDDEFNSSEFNIFVNNSSKENRAIEALRSLAEKAISSGAGTLSDIAKIVWSDSLSEITRQIEKSEMDKNAREQQQGQIQQQMQEQQLQMQDKMQQDTLELEREKMDREDFNKDADRQNKIEVALINAEGFSQDDEDLDALRESLLKQKIMQNDDRRKDQDQKRKDEAHKKDMELKERAQRHKEEIDKEKLKIQRNKPKSKQ